SSATQKMADNLSLAMLNQDDLEIVRAGSPAYLIMLDSFIEGDPENVSMLISGSKLYGSYTSAFVEDEDRAKRLADKSLALAQRALCLDLKPVCKKLDAKLDDFLPILAKIKKPEQPILFAYASAWAGWIQVNTDDWNAIAQVPKLTAMLKRSVELDENYDDGAAFLYLGVLASQIPPSLGGKPEQGRAYFEKAQSLSAGKNLMVNVLFAEHYGRLVFDQELHDRLLKQVLDADINEPGLALVNTLARKKASELLAESPDYF
ncbi:MAG: hypothetical protein KAU21_02085, partial [Gammaproteobacteria bacterium]|nr:hypothetical protein [Gammaproteobacteria bacterium]